MARLRQQHPQNYVNSGNIHTDFENVIRYLNAAELGNKTVGELLKVLFNESGDFRGPVEFRVDNQTGLQYRIGEYANDDEGWITLVQISDLRGPSGANTGTVEGPLFFNRQDSVVSTGLLGGTFTITGGGTGYTAAPTISFSNPDGDPINGVNPAATCTIDANGVVDAITLTSPGSGYLTPPTMTFTPPTTGTTATATCTLGAIASNSNVISYTFDPTTDDIVVYKNGLLQTEVAPSSEYAKDSTLNTVTLASVQLADKITIYSIRSQAVTNFRRLDETIAQAKTSVTFIHTANEKLLVYKNGILQEEGGNDDYLTNPATATITFTGTLIVGDKVSVITVENQSLKTVAGLMFEDEYTDTSGFIRYAKLAVANDEIPQTKVSNLATSLAGKANLASSNSSPTSPATGDLWLDISQVPAILKFYDGTQWLETSPESSLPTFIQSNANQYVRVNGTGTALEYGDLDFTSLVPKTFMGAQNGVASLDSSSKIPVAQLPDIFATTTIPFKNLWEDTNNTVTNKTYFITRVFKQKLRIDGINYQLSAGTCTIQLSLDGTAISGTTLNATTTNQSQSFSQIIEIDGNTSGRRLEVVVTNASSAQGLELGVAAATLSV
mgnify:FL=1